MNIDSTYRDVKSYPYATEFGVIVNSTPGYYSAGNIYSVDNIVYSRFQWNGTAETNVPNDTVEGNFTDFTTSVITLEPANQSSSLNFYVGCIFVMSSSGVSSVISYYNPETNSIALENPIPVSFYDPNAPDGTSYKIINPSYNPKNEILLLGSNLFVDLSKDNIRPLLFLKSGPTNSLFVQNVTANWILPIHKVLDHFRIVTFEEDMPSYSNGDLFQIRSSGNLFTFFAGTTNLSNAIMEYQITATGSGYSVSDVVVVYNASITDQASYIVSKVDQNGGILQMVLLNPGQDYSIGLPCMLKCGGNDTASIVIVKVQCAVGLDSFPPQKSSDFILFIPYIEPLADALFTISSIQQQYVFFANTTNATISINEPLELMLYKEQSTGLTMPLVSYKQPVCYEVSLIHLILPNQPVYGFNVLPTFFPYLMIELYNTSTVGSNSGILYTNNPYTDKVSFYCPIGNPKNPLYVSYLIVLSSSQIQTLNWAPTDDFFFRVILPNGETLKYDFDLDLSENDIITGKITTLATSNFHFWGQLTDRRVSATFSFKLKK